MCISTLNVVRSLFIWKRKINYVSMLLSIVNHIAEIVTASHAFLTAIETKLFNCVCLSGSNEREQMKGELSVKEISCSAECGGHKKVLQSGARPSVPCYSSYKSENPNGCLPKSDFRIIVPLHF